MTFSLSLSTFGGNRLHDPSYQQNQNENTPGSIPLQLNCCLTISLAHRAVSFVVVRYPERDLACLKHSEIHSCWKYSRNSPLGNASATSLDH